MIDHFYLTLLVICEIVGIILKLLQHNSLVEIEILLNITLLQHITSVSTSFLE